LRDVAAGESATNLRWRVDSAGVLAIAEGFADGFGGVGVGAIVVVGGG